jgi:hypothetical protein
MSERILSTVNNNVIKDPEEIQEKIVRTQIEIYGENIKQYRKTFKVTHDSFQYIQNPEEEDEIIENDEEVCEITGNVEDSFLARMVRKKKKGDMSRQNKVLKENEKSLPVFIYRTKQIALDYVPRFKAPAFKLFSLQLQEEALREHYNKIKKRKTEYQKVSQLLKNVKTLEEQKWQLKAENEAQKIEMKNRKSRVKREIDQHKEKVELKIKKQYRELNEKRKNFNEFKNRVYDNMKKGKEIEDNNEEYKMKKPKQGMKFKYWKKAHPSNESKKGTSKFTFRNTGGDTYWHEGDLNPERENAEFWENTYEYKYNA